MDTLAGGFPHSEISGSMLGCQLPGAFRRLPRLSSPVVAKASTACAWSLDPLTPNPGAVCGPHFFPSLRAREAPPARASRLRAAESGDSASLYIVPSTLLKNCRTSAPPLGQLPPRRSTTPTVGARLRFDPRRLATACGPRSGPPQWLPLGSTAKRGIRVVVEPGGFEPPTPGLQSRCSPG